MSVIYCAFPRTFPLPRRRRMNLNAWISRLRALQCPLSLEPSQCLSGSTVALRSSPSARLNPRSVVGFEGNINLLSNALAERRTDPTKLVADSIKAGKPIIFVSINCKHIFCYRIVRTLHQIRLVPSWDFLSSVSPFRITIIDSELIVRLSRY